MAKYINEAVRKEPLVISCLQNFIHISGYPIDSELAGRFCRPDPGISLIYLGCKEIAIFGFEGSRKVQKKTIMGLLKSEFVLEKGKSWFVYNHAQYMAFLITLHPSHAKLYINSSVENAERNANHVLINTDIFQHLCLVGNTGNSMETRKQYINIMRLTSVYLQYQQHVTNQLMGRTLMKLCGLPKEKEENEEKSVKFGFVYFIQDPKTELIKIGHTYNIVETLQSIQQEKGENSVVMKSIRTDHPKEDARELRERFESYHINGEWYSGAVLAQIEDLE
jgi:hypothetical protein